MKEFVLVTEEELKRDEETDQAHVDREKKKR